MARLRYNMSTQRFIEWMMRELPDLVREMLSCNNHFDPRHRDEVFYEGTVRAAIFATLRLRISKQWFVAAEAAYPADWGWDDRKADIIVWTATGEPIVIEVKPDENYDGIWSDISKLERRIGLKTSPVQRGIVFFGCDEVGLDNPNEWNDYMDDESDVVLIPIPLY